MKLDLALCSTVKSNLETIRFFVDYHISVGFKYLIIFLEQWDPETISFLDSKKNVIYLKCDYENISKSDYSFNINFRQIVNAQIAYSLCFDLKVDWLFHIDIDELIFSNDDSISASLSQVDTRVDQVILDIRESVIAPFHEPAHAFDSSFFKKTMSEEQIIALKALNLSLMNNTFFKGHTASKSAIRVKDENQLMDIHKHFSLKTKSFNDIKLLHFDCLLLDDFIKKFERHEKNDASFRKERKEILDAVKFGKTLKNASIYYKSLHRELFSYPKIDFEKLLMVGAIEMINFEPYGKQPDQEQEALQAIPESLLHQHSSKVVSKQLQYLEFLFDIRSTEEMYLNFVNNCSIEKLSCKFEAFVSAAEMSDKTDVAKLCIFSEQIVGEHAFLSLNTLLFLIDKRPNQAWLQEAYKRVRQKAMEINIKD